MFVPLWNQTIICVVSPRVNDAHFFYGGGHDVRLEKAWFPKK